LVRKVRRFSDELRRAVQYAGPMVNDVARHLGRSAH
jgi:hypothetical protein